MLIKSVDRGHPHKTATDTGAGLRHCLGVRFGLRLGARLGARLGVHLGLRFVLQQQTVVADEMLLEDWRFSACAPPRP